MLGADITAGNSQMDKRIIQVPLDGLAHQEDNKYLYTKLFKETNSSVAGMYVRNFTRVKDGHKAVFSIHRHIMREGTVN